jgi:hypothetical protein
MSKPLDPELDPWEQQPNETDEAYGAFFRYRSIPRGDRTLRKVAEELGKSDALMSRWSNAWSWRVRVMAWDRAEDARRVEEHWEEIEKMSKRHAAQAQMMGNVLMAPATAILTLMRDRPNLFMEYFSTTDENGNTFIDFDRMDRVVGMAMQAARILPQVMGMERLARGEPTEIVEERADPRFANQQFMGDPRKRMKAQELFAALSGMEMPKLPAAIMGTDGSDD